MRGATEVFAQYLARSCRGEARGDVGHRRSRCAAGPPNPYGDPAGHCWLAVAGPVEATRHLLTGSDEREPNMVAFAAAALQLFAEVLTA